MSQDNKPGEGEGEGDGRSTGRSLPPVVVDCSHWESDIPPDQWSTGRPVTAGRSLPPVEVDCSHWNAEPALAVSVRFDDGTLTDSFVRALRATAHAQPDAATVVVSLRDPAAVAALYGAFQGLQTAGCVIGSEADGFRVRRKAS